MENIACSSRWSRPYSRVLMALAAFPDLATMSPVSAPRKGFPVAIVCSYSSSSKGRFVPDFGDGLSFGVGIDWKLSLFCSELAGDACLCSLGLRARSEEVLSRLRCSRYASVSYASASDCGPIETALRRGWRMEVRSEGISDTSGRTSSSLR